MIDKVAVMTREIEELRKQLLEAVLVQCLWVFLSQLAFGSGPHEAPGQVALALAIAMLCSLVSLASVLLDGGGGEGRELAAGL